MGDGAVLRDAYALSRDWWLGLRVGYTQGWFFSFAPENQGWLAGASFNYAIWRNLLLTLDYQYTNERSNAQFSNFTQNQVTAGPTSARGGAAWKHSLGFQKTSISKRGEGCGWQT
jgi:hypothetical protein